MASINIKEGAWHHVAVVWDDAAGTLVLYLDGNSLALTGTPAAGMMPTLDNVLSSLGIGGILSAIGSHSLEDGGESADAEIDEVCIWDRELTATEISTLDGTFAGSPLAQTAAGERAIRVAPSNIKLIVPFDDDDVVDSAPFTSATVENGAGISFHFRPLVLTQLNASTGYTNVDLDLRTTEVSSGRAIDFSNAFDVVTGTNLYKLVCHTATVERHRFIRATTYVHATRKLTTETFTTVAGENYLVGTSILQRNLVADGDMENSQTTPPTVFWNKNAGTLSKEVTIVSQGKRSLKHVTAAGNDYAYQALVGDDTDSPLAGVANYANTQFVVFVSVYPDATFGTYPFAFVSATSTAGSYYIKATQYTEDGTSIANLTASAWNHFCFVTDTIYVDTHELYLLYQRASSGTVYWDNVHIYPNVTADGKFETPAGYAQTNCTLTSVTSASATAHSGDMRGNVVLSSTTADIEETLSLAAGRYYCATVYVQAITLNGADGDVELQVLDTADAEIASHSIIDITTPDANYHKLSVVFATAAAGNYDFKVNFVGANTDVWYVDDFYVVQLYATPAAFDPIEESHLLTPSKDVMGLYFMEGQQGLAYSNIILNPEEFGFLVRLRPQFSSTHNDANPRTLFEFQGDSDNGVKVEYVSGAWRIVWESGGVATNITDGNATSFSFDDPLEISGWVDTESRSIDGTTYYAKLFINGTEVATRTGSLSALADYEGTLYLGNSGDRNAAAFAVIDEFYLFVQAVTDNDFIGFYTEQEPLHNDNKVFTTNQAITAGDWVRVDAQTMTAEYYDEATRVRASLGAATGKFPALKPLASRKGWVLVSDDAKEIRIGFRKEWV